MEMWYIWFPFLWENACGNAKKVVDIPMQTVYYINVRCEHAEVAELADAQASGACGSNTVWVQVPSSAFFYTIVCGNAELWSQ